MSPTQRSLAMLRKDGYFVAVVEKWNPHVKIRQDLWGFIDLLAFKGDTILAIQTTSGSNVAARLTKIRENPVAAAWLTVNRRIHVHGWRKVGDRGKRKLWNCRIEEVAMTGEPCLSGNLAETFTDTEPTGTSQ